MPRLLMILALAAGSCASTAPAQIVEPIGTPIVPEPSGRPGLVILVGGIGGVDFLGPVGQRVLPAAGLPHEVREFVWTHGKGHYLKDLQDREHIAVKAHQLAGEVIRLRAEDPSRQIYLVGHSAGAAVVLEAAVWLPPGTLERIILLSAAVAPQHDLRPPLMATRREIVSFYSPLDRFVLGWGTRTFGNADRVYGPAAGMAGFTLPADLDAQDRALYERLVQVPWKPEMMLESYGGLHTSTTMPAFMARYVAPWLKP